MSLQEILAESIQHLEADGQLVQNALRLRAIRVGAIKAAGDLTGIKAAYHDEVTRILIDYFESKGPITVQRNEFWRAAANALGASFNLGWVDGGGGDIISDDDALDWYNARLEAEFGYINTLFQEARELRGEDDFDYFQWITSKADGYTRTTREFYNAGLLRASKDIMVTFMGNDGAESCDECQMLKDQRHRVSWFVRRNFVPPHGTGLSCHRGRYCQHYLQSDKGERITA